MAFSITPSTLHLLSIYSPTPSSGTSSNPKHSLTTYISVITLLSFDLWYYNPVLHLFHYTSLTIYLIQHFKHFISAISYCFSVIALLSFDFCYYTSGITSLLLRLPDYIFDTTPLTFALCYGIIFILLHLRRRTQTEWKHVLTLDRRGERTTAKYNMEYLDSSPVSSHGLLPTYKCNTLESVHSSKIK